MGNATPVDRHLPVIQSCDGCGACCREQESPPMYLLILSGVFDDDDFRDDTIRARALPDNLKQELLAYGAHIRAGKPHPRDGVCLWFDESTRGCRHYEHRPSICRKFEMGSEACHSWRDKYDVV
ncbi:MAG: YkgJ family cysteine cluster protein [Planctomycetota bacterium]|nr:YkgJ family cysteine cluster protein [Planctomycetota bacterium]